MPTSHPGPWLISFPIIDQRHQQVSGTPRAGAGRNIESEIVAPAYAQPWRVRRFGQRLPHSVLLC
ncbi:hypothetical protein CCMA1212_003821 [Trichoderma ghanense]|uniref:Uncharacterized protein n=1 Tax=Trichoderma ghanense TaxID=65468 RepID=A0ABY2H982_9HYPO